VWHRESRGGESRQSLGRRRGGGGVVEERRWPVAEEGKKMRGEERLWAHPLTCRGRCHVIKNHHQNQ
jgi:hypothetical protein